MTEAWPSSSTRPYLMGSGFTALQAMMEDLPGLREREAWHCGFANASHQT